MANLFNEITHFNPAADRKTWEGKLEEIIESIELAHRSAPAKLKKKFMSLIADLCFDTDVIRADNKQLQQAAQEVTAPSKELEQLRKFVSDGETLRIVKHPWKKTDFFTLTSAIEIDSMQLILDLVKNGACKFVTE